jgi:kynureninase
MAQRPVHQLRIYEIFEHNKAAFHLRFRDHAWRIMKGYGFTVLGFREARTAARTEFVYLLEWPDEATMRTAWSSFMADREWAEIKRRTKAAHGDLVGAIEERVLEGTPYSPWKDSH